MIQPFDVKEVNNVVSVISPDPPAFPDEQPKERLTKDKLPNHLIWRCKNGCGKN